MSTEHGLVFRLATPVVFAVLAAATAPAAALLIPVNVPYSGIPGVNIGQIDATLTLNAAGTHYVERATFTFGQHSRSLENNWDFRWVQYISQDDCPARWNGGMNPVFPFIDPPRGGWDYQAASGGADNQPFYENTGPGMFAYPNYADRHVEGVSSFTDDVPGPCRGVNVGTTWRTYLTVTNAALTGMNMFAVLAGFEWSVGRNGNDPDMDGNGDLIGGGPTNLAINAASVAVIDTAMANSGFGDWRAKFGMDLPEPGTLWVMLLALLALGARRARRETHGLLR